MTNSYKEARNRLMKACEGYIQHNQRELDGLKAKSRYRPSYVFFEEVFYYGKEDARGFNEWVCCHYYWLIICISRAINDTHGVYSYHRSYHEFEEIKWWSRGYERAPYLEPAEEVINHHIASIVLRNLTAVLNYLNFEVEKRLDFEQIRIEMQYRENDLASFRDSAQSIQIYKTLENLKSRACFAESNVELITHNQHAARYFLHLRETIEEAVPVFNCYLKGVAVQELRAFLANQELDDKEAVKAVEAQLKEGVTIELLTKNRQSQSEQDLKLLSVITICIGIGVFTTLGLVFKRLYDSGGTSINFFKPLSQNLYETMEEITSNLEETPEQLAVSKMD